MAEIMEATALTNTIWTYLDYQELPENGKRYQVIQGVLYMTPSPNSQHQDISRNLEFILWEFVKRQRLGKVFDAPMDVVFNSTDIVQPDLLFVSKSRLHLVRKEGIFGAPDLVVEIVSPSSRKLDEQLKKGLYEQYGVCEYLIVYPEEQRVIQYVLTGGKYQQLGHYLAADTVNLKTMPLAVKLAEVFATE
jgi:Uma2 family endonuclease